MFIDDDDDDDDEESAASLHQTVCHSQLGLPAVVCRDKHPVDVMSPTHCPWLPAGQCYSCIIQKKTYIDNRSQDLLFLQDKHVCIDIGLAAQPA